MKTFRRKTPRTASIAKPQLITATASYGPTVKSPTATPAVQAAQTTFARQADGVNTARIMRNGDGSITAESGFGNGTKKYSAEQIKWIMSRGASGGGLSKQDRAVYDRMMWMRANDAAKVQQAEREKAALDAAHAEDDRKRQLDMKDWEQQEKIRREARNEDELAREKRKAEADAAALAEERQYKEQQAQLQAQAKLDAENAKYEALNRKYGIAEGTRLSNKDYQNLEAGRSKWGYSRTDQQAIDTIRSDFETADRNNIYSKDRYFVNTPGGLKRVDGPDVEGADTEYNFARKAMEDKIASYQKRLVPNDQPPTAEQIYNSAIDAPDGTKLVSNGSGGLVAIPGTGPQEQKWNGMTFKDFVTNAPKTRQVEKDVSVNGKIVKQMVDVDIPYEERIALAEAEWKKRIGGGGGNSGADGGGSPIVVSPFDPLHPNNPATATAPYVPATSDDWRTKLDW